MSANSNNRLNRIKLEHKEDGLTHLSIEGVEDDEENEVIMSKEEVHKYLSERISEHLKDPEICTTLRLSQRSQELLEKAKQKYEEYHKMLKLCEFLYQNQVKLLRHIQFIPKVPTTSVGISVDLPILPSALDSVPKEVQESIFGKLSLIKKEARISDSKPASTSPIPPPPASVLKVPNLNGAKSDASSKSEVKSIEFVDLTDELDFPHHQTSSSSPIPALMIKHPAPLPPMPFYVPIKTLPNAPPKPRVSVFAERKGIVLEWDMPVNASPNGGYAELLSFELFGYQEQPNVTINSQLWQKIGSVKPLVLPMACTLTQFVEENKYHFSVRAVDIHNRCGPYSDPVNVVYTLSENKKK